MQFLKYTSIENSYRDKFIQMIRDENKDSGQWVVMEKIHGAQLSFYYNGSELKASSRTMFLTDDIDFFNYQKVMADNRDKIEKLYSLIQSEYREKKKEISQMIVYGELFGGSYPHPDVPKVKTAKRLQKGVFYHPDNLYYAFDLRVDAQYLNVEDTNRLFEAVGLFYAKPIFVGSFDECLKYPNKFPSTIAHRLGLPDIEDNIVEGIVIKPVEPRFLDVGERIILKSKNEKFIERKSRKKRPKKQEVKISEKGEQLYHEMETLVTENRLHNVLSKREEMPYPLPKDYFGDIMKAFIGDVMEEFNKDYQADYDQLDAKEQKKISKQLNQSAAKLIRSILYSNMGESSE